MAALEVRLSVENPAKIVSPNAVNAAIETANAELSGQADAGQIAAGAVTAEKLADGAVETAKLADGAVTAEKLAAGAAGVRLAGVASAVFSGTQILYAHYTNVAGLSVTMPVRQGERVLLIASVTVSGGGVGLRLTRNGAAVLEHTDNMGSKRNVMSSSGGTSKSGFSLHTVPMAALDGPAGADENRTYAVQALGLDDEWVNRSRSESDSASYMRGVSTLVALRLGPEVAG